MALFPKKPSSPPSGIPAPGRSSPGGAPPAGGSGGQAQWIRLGEHFDILKYLLEDPAHGLKWDNPAFKAYVAKISSKPLEFALGPNEKVQAQVVQIVAGGRSSMHGFHLLLKTGGRENLRRLSGTESVASRHFPAEILKKAKLAAEARAKGLQPPGSAAKPAAPPSTTRPGAAKPPSPAAGKKSVQTDLADFGEFSQPPKGIPASQPAGASSKAAHLGGDLSELGPSPEEFQSYMNSGRSPGEELPTVEPKPSAPPAAKPAAELGGDLSELGPTPEEFQTYMSGGRSPGEELPSVEPKPAPESPAEAAEEISDVDMMELTEAADAAESAAAGSTASPPPDEFAPTPDSEWLGGTPEITESPPPPSPDLGEAPTIQASEEKSYSDLDTAGDAAGFQAAPATGALAGAPSFPAGTEEDDPFAALGESAPSAESAPAVAAEQPQVAEDDAFSALDEAAPPSPPPLDTAPVPLASSPPAEFLGDSSATIAPPAVPAEVPPPATEAKPPEEEVIDAAEEYLDSGAAGTPPEPEGMMAEAERIAREVASEPAPEPPPPPMQEPPPTEPTVGVQYAHDDAQYLDGLSEEAPPPPAEETITDAEDYVKETAGDTPVAGAAESQPPASAAENEALAAAPGEAAVPMGTEETIEDAEAYAGSAQGAVPPDSPLPESVPPPPEPEMPKPPAPQPSGESFIDITGDDDIRQALEDAGGIVMTPVEPGEMPSKPSGAPSPPPPAAAEKASFGKASVPAAVKWVPFTKESSDELKAAAKKVPVSERSADKLVFNLKLLVKFPPDGSEVTGRLCVYQKRPALLVDGETAPRVLTKECFFSYL